MKFQPGDTVVYIGRNGKSEISARIGAEAIVQNPAEMIYDGMSCLTLEWTDPYGVDNLRKNQCHGGYDEETFELKIPMWTNEFATSKDDYNTEMLFKLGDKVVVYRKFSKLNSSFVWVSPDMDTVIGEEGIITGLPKSKSCPTYRIKFEPPVTCMYWFPEECLALNREQARKFAEQEKIRIDNLTKLNSYKPFKVVNDFIDKHKVDMLSNYMVMFSSNPGPSTRYMVASSDEEAIKFASLKYKNVIEIIRISRRDLNIKIFPVPSTVTTMDKV